MRAICFTHLILLSLITLITNGYKLQITKLLVMLFSRFYPNILNTLLSKYPVTCKTSGFLEQAAQNAEDFTTLRQTLKLTSSGWMSLMEFGSRYIDTNPPKHIHSEEDNWSFCRNVRQPSTFYATYSRKPKLCIKLQENPKVRTFGLCYFLLTRDHAVHPYSTYRCKTVVSLPLHLNIFGFSQVTIEHSA